MIYEEFRDEIEVIEVDLDSEKACDNHAKSARVFTKGHEGCDASRHSGLSMKKN